MKTVRVLVSLYNPNLRFLREFIVSLKNQHGVLIRLSLRVDHERDDLSVYKELVKEYFSSSEWFVGENLGSGNSFLKLLKDCKKDSQFYAFADQDDFWCPEKIKRAVDVLDENKLGAYCSNVISVDENLRLNGYSKTPKEISFKNAIVENVIFGCTMVLNLDTVRKFLINAPLKVPMHDAWLYLYLMAFESIIYDDLSYIKYRQHGKNVVGSKGSMSYYLKKIDKFFRNDFFREREIKHLREFLIIYGNELDCEFKRDLKLFINSKYNLICRFKSIFKFRRNGLIENIILKIKILTGAI